jgi:hypothetical protein
VIRHCPVPKQPCEQGQCGFDPYIVLGKDDFEEVLHNGEELIESGYARFSPNALLQSAVVSDHIKTLVRDLEGLSDGAGQAMSA